MTVKIGSCFAGIGGWELGLERAIPNSRTIWQVEQNTFCQGILKKHWPDATIYDDVCTVGAHNLEPIDLLCAGFPCQDLSLAGNQRGIHEGKKSNLFWELHRIIGELRPRIVCLENVANIIRLGGADVIGSLAAIGYDCEWTVIRSGSDFGAPHRRDRWFCVGYTRAMFDGRRTVTNSDSSRGYANAEISEHVEQVRKAQHRIAGRSSSVPPLWNNKKASDWGGVGIESAICRVDDGIPAGMDRSEFKKLRKSRLQALGNAIVPQASEWVGRQIVQSGLIDDLID